MKGRYFLSCIFLFVFVLNTFLCKTALAKEIGKIVEIEGLVLYKEKKETWKRATIGQKIFKDTYVKTGPKGRATLLFIDGSKIFLGNDTVFSTKQFILTSKKRNTVWNLLKGKIRAVISHFKGGSNIEIFTPTATAGVKGTDFLFYYKPPVNVFYGLEGKVKISGKDSSFVYLNPSEMTENTRGRSPITPIVVPFDTEEEIAKVRKALLEITSVNVPINWALSGKLPLILARWNINYGRYLIDKGNFKEALEVFQIAFDLTQDPQFRAESLLHKGTIFARFLKKIDEAKKVYQEILNEYPDTPEAETALYSLGLLYWDIGDKKQAKELLERYEILYPQGKHIDSVRSILQEVEK